MIACKVCGAGNDVGQLFCRVCDSRLPDTGVHTYVNHVEDALPHIVPPPYISQDAHQRKILVLDTTDDKIRKVIVPSKKRINFLVGRTDETYIDVDVDYRQYGALQQGVSRKHARFFLVDTTWVVQDLSSTNGTYLNEKRITPGKTFIVQNGDIVRFGKLELQVYLPIDLEFDQRQ